MKNVNRSFQIFTAAAVVSTVVAPFSVFASNSFVDVNESDYFAEAVSSLVDMGIIDGYSDGTFRPEVSMTRAEVAKLLVYALGQDAESNQTFSDVSDSAWYAPYVHTLAGLGVINGYPDGTFRPDETITRAEMAKLLVTAFPELEATSDVYVFDDVASTSWYSSYVHSLSFAEITLGTSNTTFSPNAPVHRGQAVAFLHRLNQKGLWQAPPEEVPAANEWLTVNSYTSSSIVLDGEEYDVAERLLPLLASENTVALEGALVKVVLEGTTVVKIDVLRLTAEGSEERPVTLNGFGLTFEGDIIIENNNLELLDMTIAGDLIVSNRVTTFFTATNVLAATTIINSSTSDVQVAENDEPFIAFVNSNPGELSVAQSNVIVRVTQNSLIPGLTILGDNVRIINDETSTITSVTISPNVRSVNLDGNYGTVTVTGDDDVVVTGSGTIDNIVITGDRTLQDIFPNLEQVLPRLRQVNGIENPSFVIPPVPQEPVQPRPNPTPTPPVVADLTPNQSQGSYSFTDNKDGSGTMKFEVKNQSGVAIPNLSANDFDIEIDGQTYNVGSTQTFTFDDSDDKNGIYEITFNPGFASNNVVSAKIKDVTIVTEEATVITDQRPVYEGVTIEDSEDDGYLITLTFSEAVQKGDLLNPSLSFDLNGTSTTATDSDLTYEEDGNTSTLAYKVSDDSILNLANGDTVAVTIDSNMAQNIFSVSNNLPLQPKGRVRNAVYDTISVTPFLTAENTSMTVLPASTTTRIPFPDNQRSKGFTISNDTIFIANEAGTYQVSLSIEFNGNAFSQLLVKLNGALNKNFTSFYNYNETFELNLQSGDVIAIELNPSANLTIANASLSITSE